MSHNGDTIIVSIDNNIHYLLYLKVSCTMYMNIQNNNNKLFN